ncbi:MAG: LytTR family DNA-binding domain-containing protein [Gemmatimonadota bacterium]|nr:LytTR family DNA-binding domain-containing protein [Gemmatimonadota bacterium]
MTTTTARATTNALSGWRGATALVAFWTMVALVGGTAQFLSFRAADPALTWVRTTGPAMLAALIWVPLTVAIAWGTRVFPVLSWDERPRPRALALAGHAVASAAVTFVLNAVYFAIEQPALLLEPPVYAETVALAGLRYLHINAGVYWAIALGTIAIPRIRWRDAGTAETGAAGTGSAETGLDSSTDPDPSETPAGSGEPALAVRSRGETLIVPVSQIRWIEGAGDYVRLHLERGKRLHSDRLKHLERRLDPMRFVRVHRSAIVNVHAVESVRHIGHGDCEAVLAGGDTVRVSRTRRARFTETLEAARQIDDDARSDAGHDR